jgi:hypothetical protein
MLQMLLSNNNAMIGRDKWPISRAPKALKVSKISSW